MTFSDAEEEETDGGNDNSKEAGSNKRKLAAAKNDNSSDSGSDGFESWEEDEDADNSEVEEFIARAKKRKQRRELMKKHGLRDEYEQGRDGRWRLKLADGPYAYARDLSIRTRMFYIRTSYTHAHASAQAPQALAHEQLHGVRALPAPDGNLPLGALCHVGHP